MSHKTSYDTDGELDNLTICLRISVNYLRGRESYFFSYADANSADTLQGYVSRIAFDKPYT